MKIAISTTSFGEFSNEPFCLLKKAGISFLLNPYGRKLTEEECIMLLNECVGIVAGTEPLTAKLMDASPDLKIISRCGSGMDNVDLEAAKKRGILVRSTPEGPTLAVAELTLCYALILLRQINRMDRELHNGLWKKHMGNTLRGKKLGIIGFGRIGQAVASIFSPLGVEIAFNDPIVDSKVFNKMSVDDLLSWADILSLHCSKTGGECSLLTIDHLKLMKPGRWVINASRGGIIDEEALYEMLKSGHIRGAALDVYEREPYEGPLKDLDNVILTPHIGSYALESRIQMEIDTIRNLLDALKA